LFANWRWWPNTLLAHRLASLAHAHGKGDQAAELLFQLTYERGQNISSPQVLREAAAELGLPVTEAEQALQGGAWLDQVLREDRRAKEE
jgi:predicted DsbA family dithiol-disulfide isomerase